jgi:hypothetical protein
MAWLDTEYGKTISVQNFILESDRNSGPEPDNGGALTYKALEVSQLFRLGRSVADPPHDPVFGQRSITDEAMLDVTGDGRIRQGRFFAVCFPVVVAHHLTIMEMMTMKLKITASKPVRTSAETLTQSLRYLIRSSHHLA